MTLIYILVAIATLVTITAVLMAYRSGLPGLIRERTEQRDELLQAIYSWAYSTSYVGSDRELEDRRLYATALEMATEAGWEPATAAAQGPAK